MEYYARVTKSGPDFIVAFPEFPNINTYGKSLERIGEVLGKELVISWR